MINFSLFSTELPEIRIPYGKEESQNSDSQDSESEDFGKSADTLFNPLECDFVLPSIKREIQQHLEIQRQLLIDEVRINCREELTDFSHLIVLWNKVIGDTLVTEEERKSIASDILVCLVRNTVHGKANAKEALRAFIKNDALKKCVGQTHLWVKQIMQGSQIDLYCSDIVRFLKECGKEKSLQFLVTDLEECKNRIFTDVRKQMSEAMKQSYPLGLTESIIKLVEKHRIHDLSIWNALIKFPQYELWLQCMDTLAKESPGFSIEVMDLCTEANLLNFCTSPLFEVRFERCVEHLLAQKNPQQAVEQFYQGFMSRLLQALNKRSGRDVSTPLKQFISSYEKMTQKYAFLADNPRVVEKLFEIFKSHSLMRFNQKDNSESFWESTEYLILKKYLDQGDKASIISVVDLILVVMKRKENLTDEDLQHIESLSRYGHSKEEEFAALITKPATAFAGKVLTLLYLRALSNANWNDHDKKFNITKKLNSLFASVKINDLNMWQDLMGHSLDVRCIPDLLNNLDVCLGKQPLLIAKAILSASHPLLIEIARSEQFYHLIIKIKDADPSGFEDFYLKLISRYAQDLKLNKGNKAEDHVSSSMTLLLKNYIQLFPNGFPNSYLCKDLDKLMALYLAVRPTCQDEQVISTLLEMVIKRGETVNHLLQGALKEKIEKSNKFEMKLHLVKVLKQSQMPCDFLALLKPKSLNPSQVQTVAQWILEWDKPHDHKLELSMIQIFGKLVEFRSYDLFFNLWMLQSQSYSNRVLDQVSKERQLEFLQFIHDQLKPYLDSNLTATQILRFKAYLDFSLEVFTSTENKDRLRIISQTVMLIMCHSRLKEEHVAVIESLVSYSTHFTPETTPPELAIYEAMLFCNQHAVIRSVMSKTPRGVVQFYDLGYKVAAILREYPYRQNASENQNKSIDVKVWDLLIKFLLISEGYMSINLKTNAERGEEGVWFEGTMTTIVELFCKNHADASPEDFELLDQLFKLTTDSLWIQKELAGIYNQYDDLRDKCADIIIRNQDNKIYLLTTFRELYTNHTIPLEVWKRIFSSVSNISEFTFCFDLFNDTCVRYREENRIKDICSLYHLYLHQAINIAHTMPQSHQAIFPTMLHILESVRKLSDEYELNLDNDFLMFTFSSLLNLLEKCKINTDDNVLIMKYFFLVLKDFSSQSIFRSSRLEFLQYSVKIFNFLVSNAIPNGRSEIWDVIRDWHDFSSKEILPTFTTPYTIEEEKLLLTIENCYHLCELPQIT